MFLRCAAIIVLLLVPLRGQTDPDGVPRAWDDLAVAGFELPLAVPERSPRHIRAAQYYTLPVARMWKSYPIYRPDEEPPGYIEWLKRQDPVELHPFHPHMTDRDWVEAGSVAFDMPTRFIDLEPNDLEHTLAFYRDLRIPTTPDGVLPFRRYYIREKGRIEIGMDHCGACHTRLMPDGTLLRGAQGNLPQSREAAWLHLHKPRSPQAEAHSQQLRWEYYGAPWISPREAFHPATFDEVIALGEATPAYVIAREGTSVLAPTKIPDLIGVRNRRYLDATGLTRQRGIEDLMRYAVVNQTLQLHARYGDFQPEPFDPAKVRYSDQQLYALARFIYALRPPANPNRPNALSRRGRQIFQREGCVACHTPPLYTANSLTPAAGFRVPPEHLRNYDIIPVVVGTDSALALQTRRGTGYYKVPSLLGVWYRSGFGHSAWCENLEDWFDPNRLRGDYVATGFQTGPGLVKGHEFGLRLAEADRRALIAFLRTL